MRRVVLAITAAVAVVAVVVTPATARGGAPRALSSEPSTSDVSSPYGGGIFGTWHADRFGLPSYRYTLDQVRDGRAKQPETNTTDAWHQVGNDYHHAFASNHGYTQLWSSARTYQWVNMYEPARQHYAGGFGWLKTPGAGPVSTFYEDRPSGASTERDFGVGYFHHRTTTDAADVDENVYAPFGSDPVLLHDVTITNRTASPLPASWFEYWDVNPSLQPGFPGKGPRERGLQPPTWDPASRTLSVAQLPEQGTFDPRTTDTDPLTIFASALSGPVSGFDTDVSTFFGSGNRAAPAAVTADRASNSVAPAWPPTETIAGQTMFTFRSPVTVAPGQSVTLRYAYGIAHPNAIGPVVARWRGAADPLAASERAWAGWLPQSSFPNAPWLARELQWDAYNVRSRATPEEQCGNQPVLSQGGYYQYDQGYQGAYRDPLQHMLPMISADPALARGVITYSAQEQPSIGGNIPYAMHDLCVTYYFGGEPDDLDLWLLLASAQYALATRDLAFFDQKVRWADTGTATLWDHLKLAEWHQEHVIGRGIHGLPNGGTTGDWADLSVETNQMTESTLVGAQLAYVYPLLSQVASLRGDKAFAAALRTDGDHYKSVVANEWTGKGWYSRGYSGTSQIGGDQIWSLAQPWAILAGIPDAAKTKTLLANFRRYLTGIGSPAGAATTGSSLTPPPETANDKATYSSPAGKTLGDVVASWWALNEPMVWAYGRAADADPNAGAYGWDELVRNSLATLATVHPDHWDGVIAADDVCDAWWTPPPYKCGVGGNFDTQILHQPAWELYAAGKLSGLEPTISGWRIDPQVPGDRFSLRLPDAGVAVEPSLRRGYVRPSRGGTLAMQVRLPSGVDARAVKAWAAGKQVPVRVERGWATFGLPTTAGSVADWALSWSRARR